MKYRMNWGMVGLGVVLLVLVACGCGRRETPTGYTQETTATALPQNTVGMKANAFAPREMVAPAGTTISFVNNDTRTHTVTADVMLAAAPNSDKEYPNGMKPGQSYTWTIPATASEGTTWYFHCRFHGDSGDGTAPGPGMTAAIRVGTVVTADRTGTTGDYRTGTDERRPVTPTTPRNTGGSPGY
ncbi:MAG: hypothetical protein ABFD96_15360 [Armatimonadia bacterium]